MGIEGQRAASATYFWVSVMLVLWAMIFVGLTSGCAQEADCRLSGPDDDTCAPGPCDIEQRNQAILLGGSTANLGVAAVTALVIRRKR